MASAKPQVKNAKWRLTCFTVYNMEFDFQSLLNELQFVAYGEETCPTTGRKHYQCFGYAKDARAQSWWLKVLKPNHFERCMGSLAQNEAYCSKESTLIQLGVKPIGSGSKPVLLEIKERMEHGEPLRKIRHVDGAFNAILRSERGLMAYQNQLRMEKMYAEGYKAKNIIVLTGPTGTGKTRYARELFDESDIYTMPDVSGKWAGSYDGQPCVVFDDVDCGFMPITTFLKITDGYPYEYATKGGFVPWVPTTIIFTSNIPFSSWFLGTCSAQDAAAKRRVTEFRETHVAEDLVRSGI